MISFDFLFAEREVKPPRRQTLCLQDFLFISQELRTGLLTENLVERKFAFIGAKLSKKMLHFFFSNFFFWIIKNTNLTCSKFVGVYHNICLLFICLVCLYKVHSEVHYLVMCMNGSVHLGVHILDTLMYRLLLNI